MNLSDMIVCPPEYVSWSILGMFVFPLFVIPFLRRRDAWATSAPLLVVLLPLFHSTTLAYLGIRSVFMGMSRAGTDSPVVLSAGLGEAHGALASGAIFSGVVLVTAVVIVALQRRHAPPAAPAPAAARGRLAALVVLSVELLLIGGVIAVSLTLLGASVPVRIRLFSIVIGGAIASGALTVTALVSAAWLARRSPVESATDRPRFSWRPLVVASAVIAGAGVTSWWIQRWFARIAATGVYPPW